LTWDRLLAAPIEAMPSYGGDSTVELVFGPRTLLAWFSQPWSQMMPTLYTRGEPSRNTTPAMPVDSCSVDGLLLTCMAGDAKIVELDALTLEVLRQVRLEPMHAVSAGEVLDTAFSPVFRIAPGRYVRASNSPHLKINDVKVWPGE
jgi:hypothetical protein